MDLYTTAQRIQYDDDHSTEGSVAPAVQAFQPVILTEMMSRLKNVQRRTQTIKNEINKQNTR